MIRRGESWGETSPIPDEAVWAADDPAAAAVVAEALREGRPIPPVALTGGDLARTLGGRGDEAAMRTGHATHVTVDVGSALIDGRLHWFVAHLVARRSWLRGRVVVIANAAFLGAWNIAPRAHPGDGRLDLLDGDLPLGERLRARRRLAAGTHVPHPAIACRRTAAVQLDLDRPTPIYLDGRRTGSATTLSVRVEPAALDVWV